MPDLKRRLTNVDVSEGDYGKNLALQTLMPPLPDSWCANYDQDRVMLPVVKRACSGSMTQQQQPVEPGSGSAASSSGVSLRRQLTPLTPKISWAAILSGDSKDDLMGAAAQTPRGVGCVTPAPRSPPPMRLGSAFNLDSPPARPEKPRNGWSSDMPTETHKAFEAEDGYDRFAREFENAKVVGSGCFSVVLRARNRVDKQEYAIKKTKNPLARGTQRRQEMLQEALALASVATENTCPFIVRYFSSWIEDERLFIQTELCDGSVTDLMVSLTKTRPHDPRFNDAELSAVMSDVCQGLQVLHSKNLVHLDVKPDNILTKRTVASPSRGASTTTYKIADLGLATAALGSGCDEISEGDSRYLARELLRGDLSDLKKADVFSLGMMCYELATNPKPLPCSGDEWQRLRDGHLDVHVASQLSTPMLQLIVSMVRPIPANRPACSEMLQTDVLRRETLPGEDTTLVESLQKELRQTTEVAEKEKKMRTDAEQKVANAEQKIVSAEEKADRYWSELVHLKRQEMLREVPNLPGAVLPPTVQKVQQSPTSRFKRSLTA